MSCEICGGGLMWLGNLGSVTWWRCRNCGMDQSCPCTECAPEPEEEGEVD